MKKNVMMRVASLLMVCVLATTCGISGTFAKYVTSGEAQDSARVAKFGVVITASGKEAFATTYNDTASGTQVVSTEKVVAPGTHGDLAGLTITGSPEVVVLVEVAATLTLENWMIDADGDPATPDVEYCPIVFTIDGETYGTGDGVIIPDHQSDDIADLIADIEALFDNSGTEVAVGTPLDSTYDFDISWAWDFNTAGTGDFDKFDTALGNWELNGKAKPTISFAVEATVTQVD